MYLGGVELEALGTAAILTGFSDVFLSLSSQIPRYTQAIDAFFQILLKSLFTTIYRSVPYILCAVSCMSGPQMYRKTGTSHILEQNLTTERKMY
jgi:hypothetical protein